MPDDGDERFFPRLQIGKKSWKAIFGEQGDLKKVNAIFWIVRYLETHCGSILF